MKEGFLSFFLAFCSWPRMLIEVFTRTHFGERYFSFSGVMTVFTVLAILPMTSRFGNLFGYSIAAFWGHYFTWYLFLAGFLYMSIQRRNEIKRQPSVFDFGHFSLSTGHIHPHFLTLEFGGKPVTVRAIETFWEPGIFFILGFTLWMSEQLIGFVIVIASIIYSLSYRAAYYNGDQAIMDKIDEIICSEELTKAIVEGRDSTETRGFNFYGRRPADPDAQRRMAEMLTEIDEIVEAF